MRTSTYLQLRIEELELELEWQQSRLFPEIDRCNFISFMLTKLREKLDVVLGKGA